MRCDEGLPVDGGSHIPSCTTALNYLKHFHTPSCQIKRHGFLCPAKMMKLGTDSVPSLAFQPPPRWILLSPVDGIAFAAARALP